MGMKHDFYRLVKMYGLRAVYPGMPIYGTTAEPGGKGGKYREKVYCLYALRGDLPADAITYDSRPAVAEKTHPLPEDCSTTVKQLIYQRRSYRRF